MKKANMLDILRLNQTVFTFKEILLFCQGGPILLKRRLNYYVQQGELYSIRRGIYAKNKNYNRLELATKIFTPSYISFETILVQAGIVFQYYETIFAATYQTKDILCDGHKYSFKKIKNTILTNNAGLEDKGNYFVASKERAFLDVLYLNKDYYFDNIAPLDWDKVTTLLPLYNNKRMEKRIKKYLKNLKTEE